MRFVHALLLSTALALAAASAFADPPAAPGTAPAATHRGFVRPVLFGIVAAMFLVFGAVVGANDRPKGDQKS